MPARQVIFPLTRTIRPLKRTERTHDSLKWQSVPDGKEEIYYETSLDPRELDFLAQRAARNKHGKARDGALLVRILERRRIP